MTIAPGTESETNPFIPTDREQTSPADFAGTIGKLAVEAMLFEVAATPKPGLVDRENCGAHKDMDFFTFMRSASALNRTFERFVDIGMQGKSAQPGDIFKRLQQEGIVAENTMFEATGNVNTHKGMIFSLGLLCGASGWIAGRLPMTVEHITSAAAALCEGICERAFRNLEDKRDLTKGERMFMEYGVKGVRGEAESGFETVRKVSFPLYKQLTESNIPLNDRLVQTLLHLIASVHDTNILARHNMETAAYARRYAQKAINEGGMFTERGKRLIREMDRDFIERNISPGGCADLLAITHLLAAIETAEHRPALAKRGEQRIVRRS